MHRLHLRPLTVTTWPVRQLFRSCLLLPAHVATAVIIPTIVANRAGRSCAADCLRRLWLLYVMRSGLLPIALPLRLLRLLLRLLPRHLLLRPLLLSLLHWRCMLLLLL